jgi:ribosomal protein L16 Arg81 hydroxylase
MTASSGPFDLAALLAPVRAEDFFRDYWERKPLHLSGRSPRYYDSIITNEALERIISSWDLRYPAIQLAKNGSYLPPEIYTKNTKHGSESFNAVPDVEKIQAEYRSGATVVLPAMQRTWAPLQEICAALENELSHPAHANVYLTPGNSPGFTPHYDTHEVFVLQIAGHKRWRVYQPPLPLPHRTQPFTPLGYTLPAPSLDLELKPGDLLYLPRGYVHAAHTSHSHSLHLTVGVTVYTWVELLSELIASSKEIESFRAALPPGFATRDDIRPILKNGLSRRIDELINKSASDRVIENFLQRVKSARVRPHASFRSDVRVIGLSTLLAAPEAGCCHIAQENGNTVLEFEGRKFKLPDKIRATVEDMCRRKSFRPGELSGPLDNDGKLTLTRYLHGEGFLTLVE